MVLRIFFIILILAVNTKVFAGWDLRVSPQAGVFSFQNVYEMKNRNDNTYVNLYTQSLAFSLGANFELSNATQFSPEAHLNLFIGNASIAGRSKNVRYYQKGIRNWGLLNSLYVFYYPSFVNTSENKVAGIAPGISFWYVDEKPTSPDLNSITIKPKNKNIRINPNMALRYFFTSNVQFTMSAGYELSYLQMGYFF